MDCTRTSLLLVTLTMPAVAAQAPPLMTSLVTPAAEAEQASLCHGAAYPAQWVWDPADTSREPVSATTGKPLIRQVRGGKVIATYSSFVSKSGCSYLGDETDWQRPAHAASTGCGPFTRGRTPDGSPAYRLAADGDVFLVEPAVYTGDEQMPWIGPMFDGPAEAMANTPTTVNALTIRGITRDGHRPVIAPTGDGFPDNTYDQAALYVNAGANLVIANINVDISGLMPTAPGQAAVDMDGTSGTTRLLHMRITGAQVSNHQGLFATENETGTLLLSHLELDHNGGNNGPAHNAYINNSATDPNYTVVLTHSWSHDVVYGHLFKSRAQNTVITANLFGDYGVQQGQTQSAAYLLDVPNGGRLTAIDNVFSKAASGYGSNGVLIAFGEEGDKDGRPNAIDVEHNSFTTFADTFDGSHLIFPAWWAIQPASFTYTNNVYAGFCPTGNAQYDDRGAVGLVEALGELGPSYDLQANPYVAGSGGSVIGRPTYGHVTSDSPRRSDQAMGARPLPAAP